MGIDKRKLPECPKDDTCVAYDDASWRSEGWVLLVIGILMFLGGPLCLCCIKKVRKKVLKCFGACCSSFGECCSFLACAPCKCFLTCGSACGSCCVMLFPHEESGSNVDEDEYYKALRTYEDRHKLLLERVEEEKEDPPATLSVNIKPQNGTTATLAAYKSSTVTNICRQLGVDSFTFAGQECSAQKAVGACTPNSSLQSLGVCDGASLRVQALPSSTNCQKLVLSSEAEMELAHFDAPPEKDDYFNTYADTFCCGSSNRTYDPFYRSAKTVKQMDTNNDGIVDQEEFAASGGSKTDFNRHDLNGDGVLDAHEISVADQIS